MIAGGATISEKTQGFFFLGKPEREKKWGEVHFQEGIVHCT